MRTFGEATAAAAAAAAAATAQRRQRQQHFMEWEWEKKRNLRGNVNVAGRWDKSAIAALSLCNGSASNWATDRMRASAACANNNNNNNNNAINTPPLSGVVSRSARQEETLWLDSSFASISQSKWQPLWLTDWLTDSQHVLQLNSTTYWKCCENNSLDGYYDIIKPRLK